MATSESEKRLLTVWHVERNFIWKLDTSSRGSQVLVRLVLHLFCFSRHNLIYQTQVILKVKNFYLLPTKPTFFQAHKSSLSFIIEGCWSPDEYPCDWIGLIPFFAAPIFGLGIGWKSCTNWSFQDSILWSIHLPPSVEKIGNKCSRILIQ